MNAKDLCDSPPHAMRSSRTRAVCISDVPASWPSSEVPVAVRPTSPCLLLALRRRAAPSRREKELFDMFRRTRVSLVSCGRFSVPRRVPSPRRLTWTGVCLSSVFAYFRGRHAKCFSRTVYGGELARPLSPRAYPSDLTRVRASQPFSRWQSAQRNVLTHPRLQHSQDVGAPPFASGDLRVILS
jgi:hypothetical protein